MATRRIQKTELTAVLLKSILFYSASTGLFHWKEPTAKRIKAGVLAGKIDKGYVRIRILGHDFRAHQLAWLHETGEFPEFPIDHIDGIKSNNAFENLRDGSVGINQQNIKAPKSSGSSGYLGVHANKQHGTYRAVISINGKNKQIGTFRTPEQASEAYVTAKRQFHAGCTI